MPRTSKGLRQPAELHDKATPQVKRVSSCKPRVSISEVVILRRQGLQFAGRSCRPSRRRVSPPGYVATFFQTKRNNYTKSAARGEARAESFWEWVGWCHDLIHDGRCDSVNSPVGDWRIAGTTSSTGKSFKSSVGN